MLNKHAVHIYMYYYGYYSILTSLYYLLAFNFCSYSDRNSTAKMAGRKLGEDLEQDMHQNVIRGHRVYRELEPFYRQACIAAQSIQRQLQEPCHRIFAVHLLNSHLVVYMHLNKGVNPGTQSAPNNHVRKLARKYALNRGNVLIKQMRLTISQYCMVQL